MPLPGAAYTLGSDEPKEKDIVWALVDGTLWMPARVDQPNVPPPSSSQDPSGALYCKVKFFQRLPDGKSSRVVRWATRVPGSAAAPYDVDDDDSDDDAALLLGRTGAAVGGASGTAPAPELLAFDLKDAEKCGVAAVRESVDKLREYFAERGGSGGHAPQKDEPPQSPATTTTAAAAAGGTKAAHTTGASLVPKPAEASPAPSKSPAAAVAATGHPERKPEDDDVGSPDVRAPWIIKRKPSSAAAAAVDPTAPLPTERAVAETVAGGPPRRERRLYGGRTANDDAVPSDDVLQRLLGSGTPPGTARAAAGGESSSPVLRRAKVPTAPTPTQSPTAKVTTKAAPPVPVASSKPPPQRRTAAGGHIANDDDGPFEGSLEEQIEPSPPATPSGAARPAAAGTSTAPRVPPNAVPPAKVPAARRGPAAAAGNGESTSDSDGVPIAQLVGKKKLPPPQPPATVAPAITWNVPSPPPEPNESETWHPRPAITTPVCVLPAATRIAALAADTGADDEVGLAGLITALLSLADVPSSNGRAAGAAVPGVFAARHAFASTLLHGSPAFVQSVTAAHVESLRAFAEAGLADVNDATAATAGAAILGVLARAWPVGAVTDDPGFAMPGFDLMSGVVLPSEPTRVSPFVLLLMFHGSWRVRAWARLQVSALDPKLLGPTDAAVAWAVVTLFAASELSPGTRPLPSVEAMLPAAANVNGAVADALRVLRETVASKVPASEMAEAASALVTLAAALVALAAKCSAGSPLRRVAEMALATSIAAVATSHAGEATKAAADAAGRAVADALPAASTPKNQWVDPAQLTHTCDILADWCATATARVAMSAATGDPTQWRRVDASRILALAALRRALDPAVTSLVHTAALLNDERPTSPPLPRAIAPSPLVASRVRACDAPLLLALERLAARLKDKEVCGTSAAQLAGMAAWLHAHVAVVWGSLASGANVAFTAGAGSELLCDLNVDPYVTAEGTVPPACPGYLQPNQAARDLVASIRYLEAVVCSPAAAHAWAFDVGGDHAPLFDKLLGVRDSPATTGTAAPATPAPTSIVRSMCTAALLGTVLLDATAAFHRDVMWEALQPNGGAGAVSLAAYWDVLKPAHRPQLRQPLLACLLFDPWAALFDASAATGGSDTGLAEVATRVGVVAESMRGARRRAAADEHRGFDSEDIFAIAAVRSLTNAGSPALAASDTSNDGPFQRAVAAAVDSLAFASCRATANMSAAWRVAATQRGAFVDDAATQWPAAAWAVRRELAHVVPAHGRAMCARELLVGAACDAGWAAAVEAIAGATPLVRGVLTPSQVTELSASARHAWTLVVVAVAWGTTAAKRDRLLNSATFLPSPTSAALLPLLHRRVELFLPTGALPELLVLAASTATPLPESTLDRTLALIKTLPVGTRGNVQQLAREAGCAWLADLASGNGEFEAKAADASMHETEKCFSRFEGLEQQDNGELDPPRSLKPEAPAQRAEQMVERRRQRAEDDADADERLRMQAAQRLAVVVDGGSGSGDDASMEAVVQSRRPQPAAASPKAVPAVAPHPQMQPTTVGHKFKLPATRKPPLPPRLPAPVGGRGPSAAPVVPAGAAVKTVMPRRDIPDEGCSSNSSSSSSSSTSSSTSSRSSSSSRSTSSSSRSRSRSRSSSSSSSSDHGDGIQAGARRQRPRPAAHAPPPESPAPPAAPHLQMQPTTIGGAIGRKVKLSPTHKAVPPSLPAQHAPLPNAPELPVPIPDGGSVRRAPPAPTVAERESASAVDRAVDSAKAALARCILATPLEGSALYNRNVSRAAARRRPRGADNDCGERGAVDCYVISSSAPCSVARTWPDLSSDRALNAVHAGGHNSPRALASFVTRWLPFIAAEARGEIVSTFRELLQGSRSGESGNTGDSNKQRDGGGNRVATPGGLSEYLGVARLATLPRVDSTALVVELIFVQDSREDSRDPAERMNEHDILVINFARVGAGAPAPGSNDAWPPLFAFQEDGSASSGGAKQHRADGDAVAARADSAQPSPAGSDADADPDDVVPPRGAQSRASVVGVVDAIQQGPCTPRRRISIHVSRDCPNLRAALEAHAFVDANDYRAGLRVYRTSSLATANAQIEACGKVCLMKDLWPVISDPRQHLARSDVAAAATRLAAAIAHDPTLPSDTHFNRSQLEAMNAAVAERGDSAGTRLSSFDQSLLPFALVQGPPGTGKTHTIVGLIVRWLTAHQIRDVAAHEGYRASKRVLVVAPSNIAVDEVALRLMQMRIAAPGGGGYDRSWAPNCVRHGVRNSVDPAVRARIFIDECFDRAGIIYGGNGYMRTSDVLCGGGGQLRRAVLVGDPAQLQATLLSPAASRRGYGRSLMERLVAAGYPCHMLDTQHRMHPDISRFPNAAFYGGRLRDAAKLTTHNDRELRLPLELPRGTLRVVFLDVGGPELQRGKSIANAAEADVVAGLLSGIASELGRGALQHIGVITFYQAQVSMLRDRVATVASQARDGRGGGARDRDDHAAITVGTADGFQGRECAGIILSCVRSVRASATGADGNAAAGRSIGFIGNRNRLNVALTRAKQLCVIVGDAATLRADPTWAALVDHCIAAGAFIPREHVAASLDHARAGLPPHAIAALGLPRTEV